MANELVLIEAAKEVCSTARALISTSRRMGIINKAKKQTLIVKINTYLSIEKGNAIHAISNNNIKNIESTLRLIDSMDLKGPALTYAMNQLEKEASALDQVLEDFRNGLKGDI